MARPDVIAAIATPPGRGGIGVVRVSGPDLGPLAAGVLGRLPPPRHAALASFRDRSGGLIDRGIALYFPAPASYTGEDVLELQGHGGIAVMQSLLARCLDLGARLAEPGEFTRRAFLNDKLDLAQAESVADLIDADTREAARCAMRSLSGDFSREIHALVDGLVELRSLVEATLDFPEEEIDFLEAADAAGKLAHLCEDLDRILAAGRQGSLLREGLHVVLVGQPNVGKSSLLNRLAGEEVAIVTEVPGTTRDAIRQHVEVAGIPIHVIDTAGLRHTEDPVERIGIERTRAAIDRADLVLLVVDSRSPEAPADAAILASLPLDLPRITVRNKIDLAGEPSSTQQRDGEIRVALSARTGEGLDLLREQVLRVAGWHPGSEGVFMARERHLRALREARERLEGASRDWDRLELMAEELSQAQRALSAITGEFSPDDLLGEIFGRFCIGK